MSTLKKYDLTGCNIGEVQVAEKLATAEANSQMVKDYIVAIRANARQWSANTKTRAEVEHTTKKPHPQKGGGRSRQGSLVAPQYRGGGRVFGPKPKFDQHVKINRKEKRAAILFLLAEKFRQNHLHVLDDFAMEAPRTKAVAEFLKSSDLTGRVLFLGEGSYFTLEGDEEFAPVNISVKSEKHLNFAKSLRNIPKTSFLLACNVSGYDLLVAKHVVVSSKALDELNQWLC